MTKFTIQCETPSAARDYARSLGRLEALSVSCQHIGDKTVVAIVAPESAGDVERLLEDCRAVARFEMVDA